MRSSNDVAVSVSSPRCARNWPPRRCAAPARWKPPSTPMGETIIRPMAGRRKSGEIDRSTWTYSPVVNFEKGRGGAHMRLTESPAYSVLRPRALGGCCGSSRSRLPVPAVLMLTNIASMPLRADQSVRSKTHRHYFLPSSCRPPPALHGLHAHYGESAMRRYFFHVEDEAQQIKDREGIELDGLDAVREEALQSARQIMSEDILGGRRPDGRRFVVTDEGGMIVAEIPFAEAIF